MIVKLIDPKDFKVVRVFSFIEPFTQKTVYVGYKRPLTTLYNASILDEFDQNMLMWLQSMNLDNVKIIHSEDIYFEHQLPQIDKIYNDGRPKSLLTLTCHGNYQLDEIIKMGQIEARLLTLNAYWNTSQTDSIFPFGNAVTFDKAKERYFFETIDFIESI